MHGEQDNMFIIAGFEHLYTEQGRFFQVERPARFVIHHPANFFLALVGR